MADTKHITGLIYNRKWTLEATINHLHAAYLTEKFEYVPEWNLFQIEFQVIQKKFVDTTHESLSK
jgi:hypothetical protein